MNEAIRDWIANVETTHYMIGSAAGPHPYPTLVRELQSVIGHEARAQLLDAGGRLPDVVVACVGGGSNAIGLVPRVPRRPRAPRRRRGRRRRRRPARRRRSAAAASRCCTARAPTCSATSTARSSERHSISAGLDYPGVGPEHAHLADTGAPSTCA